jgi:hypothetical protein
VWIHQRPTIARRKVYLTVQLHRHHLHRLDSSLVSHSSMTATVKGSTDKMTASAETTLESMMTMTVASLLETAMTATVTTLLDPAMTAMVTAHLDSMSVNTQCPQKLLTGSELSRCSPEQTCYGPVADKASSTATSRPRQEPRSRPDFQRSDSNTSSRGGGSQRGGKHPFPKGGARGYSKK